MTRDYNNWSQVHTPIAKYHKSHSVELGDALVAAVCFLNKALLYTLNKKHYPMRDIRMLKKVPRIID